MIDLDSIQKRLARVWGKWPTTGVAAPNADEQGPKAWAAHGPVRFHATEQGRARQWVQAQADAEFVRNAPSDIAALLAEVERLRGQRHADNEAIAGAWDAGRDNERAAVVKWLRDEAARLRKAMFVGSRAYVLESTAYMIENGVHREENE